MIGTIVGGAAIVVLTACFPQDHAAFLVGLALWGAACALATTLFRNALGLGAALAGFTAAIIGSGQLWERPGVLNGQAFALALTRCSEICIGIVCAGIILAGTNLGGAQRRLAILFAVLAADISQRFADIGTAGPDFPDTQPVRVELVRRLIMLNPAIEDVFGESTQLRRRKSQLHLLHLTTSAIRRWQDDWESRMYGRLSVLPNKAEPLQRTQ
jgi:uncharacterized membrane protein YccC